MKLPGESEDHATGLSVKYMAIGVSLCILLILGVVVFTNKEKEARKKIAGQEKEIPVMALDHAEGAAVSAAQEEAAQDENAQAETDGEGMAVYGGSGSKMKEIERLYREKRLTASDLDFWDMYPANEPDYVKNAENKYAEKNAGDTGNKKEGNEENNAASKDKYAQYDEQQEDPAHDGKHTLLTYADGSEEWVLISPYLEKNTYDFTKFQMKSDKMAYYEDGKKSSYIGADISKYNGEVDFSGLKEAGIDYAMIRLGARGYGSGQIMPDEKFAENMTKAQEAGLDTGVYFFSQAVTAEEAVEEANFVIQNLANYKITYPVAFDMEYVENDKARIEALSREEKTAVAKAFLDTVQTAGYKPMVYGTKEWLIKQVDLTQLTGYDIWLSQQKDVPDYPYQFQMWQYTLEGSVIGISGDVDLNISFIDYSEK